MKCRLSSVSFYFSSLFSVTLSLFLMKFDMINISQLKGLPSYGADLEYLHK